MAFAHGSTTDGEWHSNSKGLLFVMGSIPHPRPQESWYKWGRHLHLQKGVNVGDVHLPLCNPINTQNLLRKIPNVLNQFFQLMGAAENRELSNPSLSFFFTALTYTWKKCTMKRYSFINTICIQTTLSFLKVYWFFKGQKNKANQIWLFTKQINIHLKHLCWFHCKNRGRNVESPPPFCAAAKLLLYMENTNNFIVSYFWKPERAFLELFYKPRKLHFVWATSTEFCEYGKAAAAKVIYFSIPFPEAPSLAKMESSSLTALDYHTSIFPVATARRIFLQLQLVFVLGGGGLKGGGVILG